MRLGMSEGAILVSGTRELQAAETPSANATGQECSWLEQGAAGRPGCRVLSRGGVAAVSEIFKALCIIVRTLALASGEIGTPGVSDPKSHMI